MIRAPAFGSCAGLAKFIAVPGATIAAHPNAEKEAAMAQQVQLSDFEMGRTLGCGSFGRVKFAKYKPDPQPFPSLWLR